MKKALRIIAVMVILAMSMTALYGCGSAKAQAPAPETQKVEKVETEKKAEPPKKQEEKIKLRVTSFCVGEDPFVPSWQASLKKFREQNPNVEISDESTPVANDAFRTKVKTDFASGNEPDFAWFYTGADAKPLVESNKLLVLDDEVANDKAWSGNIAPAAIESGKINGKIYSIPVIGFYEALFCNKDMFDANGLKIPTNYDEMIKAIDTFKAKKLVPIAASIDESYYILEYFILSAGGKEGHSSEFKDQVPPSWITGINAIKEFYNRGAFPADAITLPDEQARNLFYDKKAAMMINGSWCVGQVKDKDNTVVTYFPIIKDGKAGPKDIIGGYGSGFYVSKDLNEKKGGIPLKLLKFMSSPDTVKVLTEKAGIPGVKIDTSSASPVAKSGLETFTGASSVNFPFGDRIDKEAFTNMRKNLAYVVKNKKTSEDLLKESLKLVKK